MNGIRGLSILHVGATFVAIRLALSALAVYASDAPQAAIEGGADETGHNYSWTVTNQHVSPLVEVEFPHHHADLFFAPEGWSTDVTALVTVGYTEASGVAKATADTPGAGIRRGASATFRMRIAPLPTGRGRGTVRLRFADGSEEEVGGVEVAVAQPVGDKYAPLIGLGAVFVIVIAVRRVRRRGTRPSGEPGDSEPSGAS